MPTYSANTETIEVVHTTDGSGEFESQLDYFVYSLAIKNDTNGTVQLYFNKYSDDFITIDPFSYHEIAVTTNYYKLTYTTTGEDIIISLVKSQAVEQFLTPLFPNLYEQADTDGDTVVEDIKIDPINTYGYNFTPWVSTLTGAYLGNDSTVVEVEYYFDGASLGISTSSDFYGDFYNMILTEIQSYYPDGYVAPINPGYSAVQTAEIVEKVKSYFQSYNVNLEEDFFSGYASLSYYDEELKSTTFTLSDGTAAEKIATPWTVLGGTFTAVGGNATVQYKENPQDSWNVVSVTLGTPVVFNERAKYFEVTAGTVEISFTGNYVAIIDFAPIINIVYPLGFTETEGVPAAQFATFEATLTEFKQNLSDSKFTGRVVYFKFLPFTSQAAPVYDADTIIPTDLLEDFTYVFEELRPFVNNYYQYSKLEQDLLNAIVYENWLYYHPAPTNEPVNLPETLLDVINDTNVTVRGLTSTADKKEFLLDLLKKEYMSPYGLGGLSVHTFGSTYNRKDLN